MWTRLLPACLLIVPWISHADCAIPDSKSQTISVVIGDTHCRAYSEGKLGNDPSQSQQKPSNKTNTEKLNGFLDLQNQSNFLSGRRTTYYGQKKM